MKCKMKITNDTRIYLNEEELEEALKMECPACGRPVDPYKNETWFFSRVTYFYHCHTDTRFNMKKGKYETIKGCGCKWKIKLNPKKAFRKNK